LTTKEDAQTRLTNPSQPIRGDQGASLLEPTDPVREDESPNPQGRLRRRINYRTPTVTSIGGRDGSVRSADGFIDLQVAIPEEMGGPGGKTNPEELFAAGYAACFHSAVKHVAADKKVGLGKSTVEAQVGLSFNDDGAGRMLTVELHVTLPGADAETAKDIVRGAHKICPYSNATRNNIDVKLSVTPADGNDYAVT
jgi:lipoyl-dependent peroxiredoxin